jgi:NAD(P)-dependent dehydrogenase (short-subunit alcohol dehydrogenase family)
MSEQRAKVDAVMARQKEMVQRAFDQCGRDLADRVVVVTGAARGIGKAIAQAMVKAGAKVAAADKTWAGAEEFRAELEASGKSVVLAMDIADDAQLDAAYSTTIARFGTVDVLVNNAALVSETLFAPMGHVRTLDTKDSDWETMFQVNVFGTVKVIRRFIRPMLEKKRGSIVNIISSGVLPMSLGGGYYGLRPGSIEMPYQATKAAVMALSFYLGEEVRADGIAVNAIMPGHTRASWFDDTARAYQEKGMSYFMRPAIAEHVLPIMLFLAAQDGRGVAGRLYYVPDWNFDHGYGKYADWLDHALPPDMEEAYTRVEAALPKYERSGVAHLPFDAQRALFTSAIAKLSSTE